MTDKPLCQLIRLTDWLAEHEPDLYHTDADTATTIIGLLTDLTQLRTLYADRARDLAFEHACRMEAEEEVERLRARAFGYDDAGRITYNGAPYADLSIGTTPTGIARAAEVVAWLNACLAVKP
jgi:hypothetical protein